MTEEEFALIELQNFYMWNKLHTQDTAYMYIVCTWLIVIMYLLIIAYDFLLHWFNFYYKLEFCLVCNKMHELVAYNIWMYKFWMHVLYFCIKVAEMLHALQLVLQQEDSCNLRSCVYYVDCTNIGLCSQNITSLHQ